MPKATLTKKQQEIVTKYEPTKANGKDKGSFFGNRKACAYAFCGGKNHYDETLYNLGKQAFMDAYDTDEMWAKLKGEKPTKTSRGSSNKSSNKSNNKATTLEARVDSLEEKLDKILEMLSK
jgi:hypothetical protein